MREISGSTLLNLSQTHSHDQPQTPVASHRADIPSEDSAARPSFQAGDDKTTWEAVVDIMETRHQNDIDDLKEDHALAVADLKEEIERLQGELTTAKGQEQKTEKRLKGLLKGRSVLKAEIKASKETLQGVISASQTLQSQYDELKEKYESSLALDDAEQLRATQPADQETHAECSLQKHKFLEQDIVQSGQALKAMSKDLHKALDENRHLSNEVYQLKRALE